MTRVEFKARIADYAREAETLLRANPDASAAEPIFDSVLAHVRDAPEYRTAVCEALVDLFVNGSLPVELAGYLFHALRWPELRKSFEKLRTGRRDPRSLYILERMLAAFEDDWDEREFYARWRT
jgi:hypothetical protein